MTKNEKEQVREIISNLYDHIDTSVTEENGITSSDIDDCEDEGLLDLAGELSRILS